MLRFKALQIKKKLIVLEEPNKKVKWMVVPMFFPVFKDLSWDK